MNQHLIICINFKNNMTGKTQPNQALPVRKQRGFAKSAQQASSACPDNCIAQSAILNLNERGAKFMASIGRVQN